MNIRFEDLPPQREEIFTEIEGPYEFDCPFNAMLNNAQKKLGQKRLHRERIESKTETITCFPDNEVQTITLSLIRK